MCSLLVFLSSCTIEGEGTKRFVSSSYYAFPILLVLSIYVIWEQWNKHKRAKIQVSFWTLKRFRTFCFSVFLIVFTLIVVFLIPDPKTATPEQKIKSGIATGNPTMVMQGKRDRHLKDPTNYRLIYEYLSQLTKEQGDDTHQIDSLYHHYFPLALTHDTIGLFVLASVNCLRYDYEKADIYVAQLPDNILGVNYFKSQLALYHQDTTMFIDRMNAEIELGGLVNRAYKSLGEYYVNVNELESLYSLLQNEQARKNIPFDIAGMVFYKKADAIGYIKVTFCHVADHFSYLSFLGALIILIAYTIFLRQLDLFNRESWFWVILMLSYGVFSPFFVFPFSDFLQFSLKLKWEDDWLSQLLFYTLQVGLVEEFVKLVPFMFFLFFTKKIKEPYDFVLYTSISALGFAFTENLIYFSQYGIGLMQIRGMISVIGHAIFSSSIGYLLAYYHFHKKALPVGLLLALGLLVAALLHGVFDFLLTANVLLFFIYFLAIVHMWAIMLNNCMNNSSHFDATKLPELKHFQFKAYMVLLSIVLVEFVLMTTQLGKAMAADYILGYFYPGIYLILFLSNTLGRFDFFKGYWEPVKPPGLKELIFPRTANTNEYVGKCIVLSPEEDNLLKQRKELRGVIVERKIHRGDTNWFIIMLHDSLGMENIYDDLVLIEFGASGNSLEEEMNSVCDVYVLPNNIVVGEFKITGKLLLAGSCRINLEKS